MMLNDARNHFQDAIYSLYNLQEDFRNTIDSKEREKIRLEILIFTDGFVKGFLAGEHIGFMEGVESVGYKDKEFLKKTKR